MKKVLFATTALVAFAGAAAADVAVTGSAEMGVVGGDGMQTQFHTDIDVTFTMTGETDGGITFGAAVDLDESTIADTAGGGSTNGAFGNDADDGGVAIFISGDFGTLTMGDTDGAFDAALQEVAVGAGTIADNETAHGGYNGNAGFDGDYDGQILSYSYSFSGFTIIGSVEIDDTGVGDAIYGIGGRYTFDFSGGSATVGIGYQNRPGLFGNDGNLFGVSADVNLDAGVRVVVNYSEGDTDLGGVDETHFAIGGSYTFDAFTIAANYGMYEEGANEDSGYGLAAQYDLGGGLTAHLGYGDTTCGGVFAGCSAGANWSFGVAMSF